MNKWDEIMFSEFRKPYYQELDRKLKEAYSTKTCYPPYGQIFRAFSDTPFEKVKCVIIGQDPYHEPGQAMGLAFSVPEGEKLPRSLRNIYKELDSEYGCGMKTSGDLSNWAQQGVLLLNSVLTVEQGKPGSHREFGWMDFTDRIIKELDKKTEPVVFMLWGDFAKSKKKLISNPSHLILEAPHPSPFSARRGFFGCGHFKTANEFLKKEGQQEIDWIS